jgi:pyruvate dehydrogenase E1 component alpha subunit
MATKSKKTDIGGDGAVEPAVIVGAKDPGASSRDVNYLLDLAPIQERNHKDLGLSDEDVLEMFRNMELQRRFELLAARGQREGFIRGFLHLYDGQEAISTGTAFALERGKDQVITAYRDHGHALALGMDPNACMAELFGRIDGCSRGKGGSMHFFSKEKGFLGGHGIVGGQIPLAVGVAFGLKYKGTDNICVGFMGDGAAQQGAVHEACNIAGLYNLPAILVVENNLYGMGTSVARSSAVLDLYKRAEGYDMHGALINGMDVLEVYAQMKHFVALARKGEPSFLEIRTYRFRGHSASDAQHYRTKAEMEARKNDDPIAGLKNYLVDKKVSDVEALNAIEDNIKQICEDAVTFAKNSPQPDIKTMYEDVYVGDYDFIS